MKSHLNDPIFSHFLPDPTLILGDDTADTGSRKNKGRYREVFHIEKGFIIYYPKPAQRGRVEARI